MFVNCTVTCHNLYVSNSIKNNNNNCEIIKILIIFIGSVKYFTLKL